MPRVREIHHVKCSVYSNLSVASKLIKLGQFSAITVADSENNGDKILHHSNNGHNPSKHNSDACNNDPIKEK